MNVQVTGSKNYSASIEKMSQPIMPLKDRDKLLGIVVKGSPEVGAKLLARPVHMFKRFDYSYQWLRNGELVAGASDRTYLLTAQDAERLVSVRVCITLAGINPECLEQPLYQPVRRGLLKKVTSSITGFAKPNRLLTAGKVHSSSDVLVSYQWLRDSIPISGATSKTYLVTSSDIGSQIVLRVTARKDGYLTENRDSFPKTITN
jgi:hypothetical protein